MCPRAEMDFSNRDFCGALLQYPDTNGDVYDYSALVESAHTNGVSTQVVDLRLFSSFLDIPGASRIKTYDKSLIQIFSGKINTDNLIGLKSISSCLAPAVCGAEHVTSTSPLRQM